MKTSIEFAGGAGELTAWTLWLVPENRMLPVSVSVASRPSPSSPTPATVVREPSALEDLKMVSSRVSQPEVAFVSPMLKKSPLMAAIAPALVAVWLNGAALATTSPPAISMSLCSVGFVRSAVRTFAFSQPLADSVWKLCSVMPGAISVVVSLSVSGASA